MCFAVLTWIRVFRRIGVTYLYSGMTFIKTILQVVFTIIINFIYEITLITIYNCYIYYMSLNYLWYNLYHVFVFACMMLFY